MRFIPPAATRAGSAQRANPTLVKFTHECVGFTRNSFLGQMSLNDFLGNRVVLCSETHIIKLARAVLKRKLPVAER